MTSRLCLTIALTLISITSALSQQDRWRQLVPLESTRKEVERVLGKPASYFKTYGIYKEMPDVAISVWYSSGKCSDPGAESPRYDVRAGLMTRLHVTFRRQRKLSEFEPDITMFTRRQFKQLGDQVYYYSPDGSVVYTVFVEKDGSQTVLSASIQPGDNRDGQKCGTP